MNIINVLRNANNYFSVKFSKNGMSISQQKKYLYKFKEPIDDIECSYYQYKCQMKNNELFIMKIVKNLVSFFMILFYSFKIPRSNKNKLYEQIEKIFMFDDENTKFLPSSLNQNIKQINFKDKFLLNKNDRIFIKEIIKRYPISFLFIFKNMIKIAAYSSAIDIYKPNIVICSCEYSYTSSILTKYCEDRGIKHINIMHGEKYFYIREAFCRFSKFYVWDKFYVDLFKLLRAGDSEFIVEMPPSMLLNLDKYNIKEVEKSDYKFYLAVENDNTLTILKKSIELLIDGGKKVILRPHPIYTELKLLTKYFSNDIIENPKNVEIGLSIAKTKCVIARESTVLNQAYNNGVSIAIDDISNIVEYKMLKERNYIMLNKTYDLLSRILEE